MCPPLVIKAVGGPQQLAMSVCRAIDFAPRCISIIGPPGSGKRSIARKMAQTYGVEVVEPGALVQQHMETCTMVSC